MVNDDARARILGALRSVKREKPVSSPGLDGPWTAANDLAAAFRRNAIAAGATFLDDPSDGGHRSLDDAIRARIAELGARRVVAVGVDVGIDGVEHAPVAARPHDFANVDLAILRAEFGVAENGAVWITDRTVSERSLWFLAEHLIVVLPDTLSDHALVPNLHAAYSRIARLNSPFGMFLSGPSKTADIEQALVIGAHGARGLGIAVASQDDQRAF